MCASFVQVNVRFQDCRAGDSADSSIHKVAAKIRALWGKESADSAACTKLEDSDTPAERPESGEYVVVDRSYCASSSTAAITAADS